MTASAIAAATAQCEKIMTAASLVKKGSHFAKH
jgi:hypothetical protein